jgi:hypothetical protein
LIAPRRAIKEKCACEKEHTCNLKLHRFLLHRLPARAATSGAVGVVLEHSDGDLGASVRRRRRAIQAFITRGPLVDGFVVTEGRHAWGRRQVTSAAPIRVGQEQHLAADGFVVRGIVVLLRVTAGLQWRCGEVGNVLLLAAKLCVAMCEGALVSKRALRVLDKVLAHGGLELGGLHFTAEVLCGAGHCLKVCSVDV